MKTDFFASDDIEIKNKKFNKKKSVILEEDKSEDDEITMKKINIEIKKLSEAIISDERTLKKYKSSDKRDMSDMSYDQSSEVEDRKKIKNREKIKINQNIKNKLEKITEKDDEDDEDDEEENEDKKINIKKGDENTISKTSEDNKVQLYNEFKKFLLEKKIEDGVVKKIEGNGNGNGVIKKGVLKKGVIKKGILKKVDDNKTIQEMHKLASQLKNKLQIDENTNYIQNFVPNYDLSDTISGIINNELQKN
jgi:hypothetical protein